jgi:hypothetical protein
VVGAAQPKGGSRSRKGVAMFNEISRLESETKLTVSP